jgi:hypothetical protein
MRFYIGNLALSEHAAVYAKQVICAHGWDMNNKTSHRLRSAILTELFAPVVPIWAGTVPHSADHTSIYASPCDA